MSLEKLNKFNCDSIILFFDIGNDYTFLWRKKYPVRSDLAIYQEVKIRRGKCLKKKKNTINPRNRKKKSNKIKIIRY